MACLWAIFLCCRFQIDGRYGRSTGLQGSSLKGNILLFHLVALLYALCLYELYKDDCIGLKFQLNWRFRKCQDQHLLANVLPSLHNEIARDAIKTILLLSCFPVLQINKECVRSNLYKHWVFFKNMFLPSQVYKACEDFDKSLQCYVKSQGGYNRTGGLQRCIFDILQTPYPFRHKW